MSREDRQLEVIKYNKLAKLAYEDGRDYITCEDITHLFDIGEDKDKVRLDTLEILGNTTGFGWEDTTLCAFVAFEGVGNQEYKE